MMYTYSFCWDDPFLEWRLRAINVQIHDIINILKLDRTRPATVYALPDWHGDTAKLEFKPGRC